MSLEFRIEPRGTYLYVLVTGIFALREAQECTLRILDACVEHRLTKVLVDHRSLRGEMSVMDRWEYATHIADRQMDYIANRGLQPLHLAYVGTHLVDPQKFGETVAINRGVMVKSMTYLAEAFAWLGVEPDARMEAGQGE